MTRSAAAPAASPPPPAPSLPPAPHPAGFWQGVWRVADPKITLASVAGLTLGAAAAAREGPLAWGWLALTVLGIFAVEVAKNASGEAFDWDSGADQAVSEADRSPFSGGKRVLVDGLMSRRAILAVALVAYVLGAAIGLAIVAGREPAVLWFGVVGMALAYFYHAPPVALSYRGLGELAVGVAYGPVITAGTYLVQRGAVSPGAVALSVPLGLLVSAFLWINEFPDRKADAAAGKHTLVVRLGPARAARAYTFLLAAAFALLPVGVLAFGLPWSTLLGLAGVPTAVLAARRLLADPETTAHIVPAQGQTLLTFLLYAAGTSAGLLLGG